jgi:hypothetical protein
MSVRIDSVGDANAHMRASLRRAFNNFDRRHPGRLSSTHLEILVEYAFSTLHDEGNEAALMKIASKSSAFEQSH